MFPLAIGAVVIVSGGLVGLREVLKRSISQAHTEAKELMEESVKDFGDEMDSQRAKLGEQLAVFADGLSEAAKKAFG